SEEDCPDLGARARLLAKLAERRELAPDGQLALARAAHELVEWGGPAVLVALAARPDATEATLALALADAAKAGRGGCRAILLRAIERGLSPSLREHFLEATRGIDAEEERAPLLEAFARAPLEPAEQLALVKQAAALSSAGARRVLLRLIANREATDDAVVAGEKAALALVQPEDTREVLLAAMATNRKAAAAAAIHEVLESREEKTQLAVVDAALSLPALEEPAQLELVQLLAQHTHVKHRFAKLATCAWTTDRTRALIVT